MTMTAPCLWCSLLGTVLLFQASIAQPTQCQAQVYSALSCLESHPWLCIGENEENGGGICGSSSTAGCCCVNAAGTLSSKCDEDGVFNLCCDGHCLDPEEWECCGQEKCLKETHLCLEEEGICVQKGNPSLEIPMLIVIGTIWCCCCLCCCLCEAKIWLPRCAFTSLLLGAFLCTLGFATWDASGPLDRRPLVVASLVVLPMGVLVLCCAACIKDDSGNNVLWASINERVVYRIVDIEGNVLAEKVEVKQANHVQSLPQQFTSGQIRGLQGMNIGKKEENHTTIHAPPRGGARPPAPAQPAQPDRAAPAGGQENKIEIC